MPTANTIKEATVNSTLSGAQSYADITALVDGGYVVSWSSNQNGEYDVYARRYDAKGEPMGDEFIIRPKLIKE